jgi:general secretion pathway protein M
MKTWWQQLTIREQKLVAGLSSVVFVFLFYQLAWLPLSEALQKAESKLARQQQLLSWVEINTAHYQTAKKGSRTSSGSLSSIVNRTASNHGINITRMQPQGDDVQVWLDQVPFTKLLQWLEQLEVNEGLKVQVIDLNQDEQAGMVRVRRLQLGNN